MVVMVMVMVVMMVMRKVMVVVKVMVVMKVMMMVGGDVDGEDMVKIMVMVMMMFLPPSNSLLHRILLFSAFCALI